MSADNPLIASANPLDNPNAFGPSLVSATEGGLFAFSGIATVADSLRLAEDCAAAGAGARCVAWPDAAGQAQ